MQSFHRECGIPGDAQLHAAAFGSGVRELDTAFFVVDDIDVMANKYGQSTRYGEWEYAEIPVDGCEEINTACLVTPSFQSRKDSESGKQSHIEFAILLDGRVDPWGANEIFRQENREQGTGNRGIKRHLGRVCARHGVTRYYLTARSDELCRPTGTEERTSRACPTQSGKRGRI